MVATEITNNTKVVRWPIIVGNMLEWYDYSIYAYLAPAFVILFFPTKNVATSLIATFGIFAVGFIMRPVGGIIFGHFGDRYGRKKTLAFTMILMAFSTAAIGLLPTYYQIGIFAPIAFTICRLLQSLAMGGELTGSYVYLIEQAPANKRGLYGSLCYLGITLGLLLASSVAALTTSVANTEELLAWAWRIPFLLGASVSLVGFYLRSRMPESREFLASQKRGIAFIPFFSILKRNPINLLRAFTFNLFLGSIFFVMNVFFPTYVNLYLKMPLNISLTMTSINIALLLFLVPFFGYWSDKIGRKPLLITASACMFLFSYFLFMIAASKTPMAIFCVQALIIMMLTVFAGVIPSAITEMFETNIRYTAVSLAVNISAIFNSLSPLLASGLIGITDNILSPSYILIVCGLLAFIASIGMKETYNKPLSKIENVKHDFS